MLKELYKIFSEHPEISTDTRNISQGSVYFALKGSNFNGDNFAEEALLKGASFAVVSKELKTGNDRFIKVDNVLETLQNLANYHRKQLGIKILAITGSNGKTTTKELCKAILAKKFSVLATSGNLNNHIGVPLTLLSIHKDIHFGIIEMGANHPGEIKALCEIAEPDFGLITNVGKAHLEGFGSVEGVAKAKGEMFEYLMKKNGTIFLNKSNRYIESMVPEGYKNLVAYHSDSFSGEAVSVNPFLVVNLNLKGKERIIHTRLIGKYNIENVVAAAAVGHYFDISADEIKDAIENYFPDNNRSQLVDTGKNKIILDAYNANPSSMKNALENFIELEADEKVFILGQMLELGRDSESEHRSVVDFLKERKIKSVFLVGKEFKKFSQGFEYFENADELIEVLKKNPVNSSTILIKGSRGNKLEKTVPYL